MGIDSVDKLNFVHKQENNKHDLNWRMDGCWYPQELNLSIYIFLN